MKNTFCFSIVNKAVTGAYYLMGKQTIGQIAAIVHNNVPLN